MGIPMNSLDRTDKPVVSVSVNLDDLMHEAVDMLKMVHSEIETISGAIGTHVNESMGTTVNDVVHIVENVKVITDNLAQTTGTFYQPIALVIILFLFILIMLIIFLLIALKTRREYKKRPIKAFSRYRQKADKHGRVEPSPPRRSTSVLSATAPPEEAGFVTEKKKRNDTLV